MDVELSKAVANRLRELRLPDDPGVNPLVAALFNGAVLVSVDLSPKHFGAWAIPPDTSLHQVLRSIQSARNGFTPIDPGALPY